jgi:hypothetical protein
MLSGEFELAVEANVSPECLQRRKAKRHDCD